MYSFFKRLSHTTLPSACGILREETDGRVSLFCRVRDSTSGFTPELDILNIVEEIIGGVNDDIFF
jgi:hypothetical protein